MPEEILGFIAHVRHDLTEQEVDEIETKLWNTRGIVRVKIMRTDGKEKVDGSDSRFINHGKS